MSGTRNICCFCKQSNLISCLWRAYHVVPFYIRRRDNQIITKIIHGEYIKEKYSELCKLITKLGLVWCVSLVSLFFKLQSYSVKKSTKERRSWKLRKRRDIKRHRIFVIYSVINHEYKVFILKFRLLFWYIQALTKRSKNLPKIYPKFKCTEELGPSNSC